MTATVITYYPPPGEHIDRACREAVDLANRSGCPVAFSFNATPVVVDLGESPAAARGRWDAENARQSEAYRNSPEGHAAEARAADRLRNMQQQTDDLIVRLPGVVYDLGAMVRWCVELSRAADHVGVKWSPSGVARLIVAARWVPGAHVDRPPCDFTDRRIVGEYIVGQAIDCMRKGLPPHQVIEKFAKEGGFIA